MKWVKVSDWFPEDWEQKILREIGTNGPWDCDYWVHENDRFVNTFDYRIKMYEQVEWLYEGDTELESAIQLIKDIRHGNIYKDLVDACANFLIEHGYEKL